MRQLMDAPESQEWFQLKLDRLIRIHNGVSDHQLFLVMNQQTLLLEKDIAYPVGRPGNVLYIKIFNVLMTFRTVIITVIFADTRVETLPVTDYRSVKTRQQNMPPAPQRIDRTYKQAMVFAGIASHNGCA
jgi:hypothetical protein